MALRITSRRQRIPATEYFLVFDVDHGSFMFACDELGNMTSPSPAGLEIAELARKQGLNGYVQAYTRHTVKPAEGKCGCGRTVYLSDPMDNVCDCGACYNMSGQQVIPSWELTDDGYPSHPWYDA